MLKGKYSNIVFIFFAVLLIVGVLYSFWVKNNLTIIESNTSSTKVMDTKKDTSGVESPRELDGCVITGCSGEVCSDEPVNTTCEYKEVYACYKNAICSRQVDGKCGWTVTSDVKKCVGNIAK